MGEIWDVAVVGCGPVGLMTAVSLAMRGHRVVIVERQAAAYGLPRAVTFDDEVARLLAAAGLGDRLGDISEPADEYEWQNASGQVLLRFEWDTPGPSGWPRTSMFSQPALEALLAERARELDVTVRRGVRVTGVAQTPERATLTLDTGEAVHARYVAGCDGAGSTVRSFMDTAVTDLGFFYDWLVVDLVTERRWKPVNLQICDPARPTTVVSGGPGRRRFEFMCLPDERKEDLNRPEVAWALLAPFGLTPADAALERHAVYTFQAAWVDRWRDGRVLIAGDAAHRMPPFAGQGLCAGIRDAANLAWKLDLVINGHAGPALLDTYGAERGGHVRAVIETSIELGKIICVPDAAAAAVRDKELNADGGGMVITDLPGFPLASGLIRADGLGGRLCPQGRVAWNGRVGLFDEVVGTGRFAALAVDDPQAALKDDELAFCARLGVRAIRLDDTFDVDGTYRAFLAGAGCTAMVVRPDFQVFGAAGPGALGGLGGLVRDLRAALGGGGSPG
ncbi:bifunctional 3-(3-hydroxy-phenyl)propionate/3-hydroxycinnamic acid hydroxylase MhpA [Actinomadura rudentiformis]|uniref:Bifunctional 3-(3-hydroxy-phenyl)propionate/3-hydroxycinnamic acid hydroxylase n=1 Tax=Actinomadura rudentiformis TaxID=359158 RepID=A0A6H9Z4G8_9ACTN|nr:bifunctional 3-(3-hydroxy-phenyl)propionate/3-hydroxycinnamic acid hydroxylase [Actinomadura rudentiformis]KAB2352158.1 bifunctional 3-(3-hydroxy-phenyl)propionate/3-hydroxycinnamic acid hydroxylase [Actinomadura rudentiformis]